MSWYELYKHSRPHERHEMLVLMFERAERRKLLVSLLLHFVEYMETESRARFVFPLLYIQGLALAIGLMIGSGFGLLLILAVALALVGLVALHVSARSEEDPTL